MLAKLQLAKCRISQRECSDTLSFCWDKDIVYSPNKYRETEGIKDNHANAIYPLGIKDGNIYVLPGLYGYEKDTAEWIRQAEGIIPKNRIMWCDSAEPDRIKTWKKAGYKARPVSKERTTEKKYQATQIDWLKGIPESEQEKPIRRMIYIHPSNVNFIKEIEQWKWKHDDRFDIYLDEPVPFFDDAMAALRYGTEGWRKPLQKVILKTFKGGI